VCGPVVAAAQILGRRTLIQEQKQRSGGDDTDARPRADESNCVNTRGVPASQGQYPPERKSDAGHSRRGPQGGRGAVLRARRKEKNASRLWRKPGRRHYQRGDGPPGGSLAGGGIQVIWQTGDVDFETSGGVRGVPGGSELYPFIERMECAYAACDLAVCRSGATCAGGTTQDRRYVDTHSRSLCRSGSPD